MADEKKPDPPPLFEPSQRQREAWDAWVAERSPEIQDVIRKHRLEPWRLYRLMPGTTLVTIARLNEPLHGRPVTLTVEVQGTNEEIAGVSPEDLEPVAPKTRVH